MKTKRTQTIRGDEEIRISFDELHRLLRESRREFIESTLEQRAAELEQQKRSATEAKNKEREQFAKDLSEFLQRAGAIDSPYSLLRINAALLALERDCGSATPKEEFVLDILTDYAMGHLTPEGATGSVESFRDNFESMTRETRAFIKANPGAFRDLCAEIMAA